MSQPTHSRADGLDWVGNHSRFKRQQVVRLVHRQELPAKLIAERLDVPEDVVLRISREERVKLPSWHGYFAWAPA